MQQHVDRMAKMAAIVLAVVISATALTGRAALYTWDADTGTAGIQNGSGTWSTSAANWTADGGVTHQAWNNAAGDTARFTTPNTVGTVTLGEDISVLKLDMQPHYANGYVFDGQGAYTLTLGTGGYVTSRAQTFNVDIDLAGSQSWGLYGGPTTINGDIGETTPSQLSGTATAGLFLYGNNTFSLGYTLANSYVGVGSNTALGSGTLSMSANTSLKRIEALGGARTLANPMQSAYADPNNPLPFTLSGSNDLTFTGDYNLVGPVGSTLNFVVTNSAITTFTGKIISGGGNKNVIKSGDGVLVLSGNSDYTGTTNVTAGTLYIEGVTSGQGNYTVASGATLAGQGTIGLASSVTAESGATISPGSVGDSTGALTVTSGDIILEAGSTLKIEIGGETAGTDYDQLITDGTLTINGGTLTIEFVDGYQPVVDAAASFQILDWDTLAGSAFDAIALPGLSDPYMWWDTSSLYSLGVITAAIPEPASLTLLAATALLAFRRRR